MYFLGDKTWKLKLLLDSWVSEWMLCLKHENNINLIVHLHTRALAWPGALSMSSNILKGIFFFWAADLNIGLKLFSKPWSKQMCYHPGFTVPFIEHRQTRFLIILRGTRIFRVVNEHWLQLKVTSCIKPLTRQSACPLKLEVRNWPLSHYESPIWHVLPIEDCFVYIENLLYSIATFINYLS